MNRNAKIPVVRTNLEQYTPADISIFNNNEQLLLPVNFAKSIVPYKQMARTAFYDILKLIKSEQETRYKDPYNSNNHIKKEPDGTIKLRLSLYDDANVQPNRYGEYINSLQELFQVTLRFDKGEKECIYPMFRKVEMYKTYSSEIYIFFEPDIYEQLVTISKGYIRFFKEVAGNVICCKYSAPLYLMCCRYRTYDKPIRFTIPQLRKYLGIKETSYKQYAKLNQNVLKPAEIELYEKADVYFTLQEYGWKDNEPEKIEFIVHTRVLSKSDNNRLQKNKGLIERMLYTLLPNGDWIQEILSYANTFYDVESLQTAASLLYDKYLKGELALSNVGYESYIKKAMQNALSGNIEFIKTK